MRESSVDPGVPLLHVNTSSSSNESHHLLVHNALLGLRSQNWSSAYQDAKKVTLDRFFRLLRTYPHVESIDIRPSVMGYITNALARIGGGELEEAIRVFDLAFCNCNPNESDLLLLIKVCDS